MFLRSLDGQAAKIEPGYFQVFGLDFPMLTNFALHSLGEYWVYTAMHACFSEMPGNGQINKSPLGRGFSFASSLTVYVRAYQEKSFQILDLLAHLLDQQLELQRDAADRA